MLWKQQDHTTPVGSGGAPLGSAKSTQILTNHGETVKSRKDGGGGGVEQRMMVSRGTVLFPFQGSKIKHQQAEAYFLDLELGEVLTDILDREVAPGWSYGRKHSTKEYGLFPTSYVVRTQHENQEFLDKIAEVCREWGEMWNKLYVDVHSYQFEVIRRGIDDLMEGRRQILNQSLTQDQYREVTRKICSKIDWGNRKLGLDLVPWSWLLPESEESDEIGESNQFLSDALRHDNSIEINSGLQIGAGRLFKLHTKSVENADVARGSNTVSRPKNKREQHNNLCVSIRDFSYQMTDDCEIITSLYDGYSRQFISERHLICHTQLAKSSFHMNEERLHPMIFQQVPTSRRDLFLVVYIIRIGRMFSENSTKKLAKRRFRRPLACGVLKLTDIDQLNDDESIHSCSVREQMIKMYGCDEKDYWQAHELIISNNFRNAITSKINLASCFLSVAVFWCGSTLVTAGSAPSGTAPNSQGPGYQLVSLIDASSLIVPPGLVRNDVYITLVTVDLIEKKPNKTGGTKNCNIEVEVQVTNEEDELVEDLPGNPYKSLIFYHQNSPKFMETIKFSIPIEHFPKSRLRLLFRHCSAKEKVDKKMFGITWLSLMDSSGTTLNNGDHTIHIFKWHDENSMPKQLTNANISKDTVTINSLIISTKFTQNMDLVNLLKWKQTTNLKPSLLNLIQSTEATDEIVRKFLPDVLDALFTVFSDEEGNSTENSGDVFTLLVNIFQLLSQPQYTAYKSVLDTYCLEQFSAALVYKGLLQSLKHYTTVFLLQECVTDEINETIKNCYFSLKYIFKFIVQSQGLFARATGGHLEDSFRRDVKTLVCAFCKVFSMQTPTSMVVETQSVLLQNLHSMYEELLRVMTISDVCELICQIFDSIPLQDTAGHPLSPAKLQAIHRVVKCTLFKNSLCRTKLLPVICKHIRHHLQHREELKLCTEVLNDILIYLHGIRKRNNEEAREAHADVEVVCTTTLEMLVQAVLVLERTSSVVGNLVTCLVGLLEQMDSFHYNRLWDEFHERKPLRDLLYRIFLLFRDLIKQDVFPSDWAVMKLLTNHVMLITLQEICQPLVTYFLNMFDVQLWTQYFNLAVIFISQPCLQLETFRSTKREVILERYGDMRLEMGKQMMHMWEQLSDSEKRNFIPSLIGPFLEVTMIPEPRLRSKTLSLFFYDMMKAEYRLNGNFKETESELIDKLDSLINAPDLRRHHGGTDEDYRIQFKEMHLLRLQSENGGMSGGAESKIDNVWSAMCAKAVESLSHLLQLLLDYRNIANLGNLDENRDKLMQCTVNLLKYYKEENRTDQYFRYVYKLHDLHISTQNYTEAGFTLLLHGDHLNWDWERVLCETWDGVQYSRQREAERKEAIYLQVLAYFDQGKMWEKGIKLCKELANEYERRFDYTKLSKILQMQASFYDNILVQHRPEPEYFRVGFFGKAFPPFVRNKEFVYRGLEYERLGTFISRIVAEWPHAELLQKNSPPDPSLLQSNGQFIQICSVRPIPSGKKNMCLGSAPEKIRTFYRVNDVSQFQFDRRLQKLTANDTSPPPPDEKNEFKYMWIERTTMKTGSELPSILRWLEIVEKEMEELSPIEFACEKMEEANSQLQTLIATYTARDEQAQNEIRSINPLSMKLQGMLDAAVQGGIPKYTEAFFNEEYLKSSEQSHMFVARLVALLTEQVSILHEGLAIHGKLVPPGVQPLHKRLLECHADMKKQVQKTEADIAAFFAAHHHQNNQQNQNQLQNNPMRRSESGNNLVLIRDSFRRAGSKSIVNSPLPPVPKANGTCKLDNGSKSVSNRSSVCSNDYGQLRPHYMGEDEYDDVYSQPVEDNMKPPCIPSRLKKRIQSSSTDGNCTSNEYIVMPPSRLREIGAAAATTTADGQTNIHNNNSSSSPIPPPKPPPKPTSNHNVGGSTSPPPILPKRGQLPLGVGEGGAMLGSKTPSTTSLASAGGATGGDQPDSPTKKQAGTPPPIPPKPKQSQNNKHLLHHSTYLNKAELMMSMENEDKVNENSTGSAEESNPNGVIALSQSFERSPSRNSQESSGTGTISRVRKSVQHKEYYTLPGKDAATKENS